MTSSTAAAALLANLKDLDAPQLRRRASFGEWRHRNPDRKKYSVRLVRSDQAD